MYNNREYNPAYITNATSTQIFTGKGIVRAVIVGTTTGTAFVVYDSVGTTTGTVCLLKSSVAENTYTLDATIAKGLFLTMGIAGTYTVTWTK